MSEAAVKRYGVTPIARFPVSRRGVPPQVMGIGPVEAIPRRLAQQRASPDIGWTELNEAFAAQALAVMRQLGMDPAKVNPLGGAIALGHPLGATGAIRTDLMAARCSATPKPPLRHDQHVHRHRHGRGGVSSAAERKIHPRLPCAELHAERERVPEGASPVLRGTAYDVNDGKAVTRVIPGVIVW